MSLAMYAAPFNENSNDLDNRNDAISQKRLHNKTQKMYPKDNNYNSDKVNHILESMHSINSMEDNDLGDFSPPPKPESSGVTKTIATEESMNKSNHLTTEMFSTQPQKAPQASSGNNKYHLNTYNTGDASKINEEYYQNMIPNWKSTTPTSSNNAYTNEPKYSYNGDDVLLKKLNYMIHLLEENKDDKTNNVTEEVVLYSFLGIFIIFVIDSFVKVGRYVR
tara:strand:- start:818 stop:1480 length:663 start_codon:yes stop_codon:yes gene_type:complete